MEIPLPYTLLETSITVDGVPYANMLEVQVAAVRAALLRLDSSLTEEALPIVVGETGWPTAGDPTATPENAAVYVQNAAASSVSLYLFEVRPCVISHTQSGGLGLRPMGTRSFRHSKSRGLAVEYAVVVHSCSA